MTRWRGCEFRGLAAARRRAKTRRIKGAGTCRKPNDSLTWLVNNLVIQLDVTCDILVRKSCRGGADTRQAAGAI